MTQSLISALLAFACVVGVRAQVVVKPASVLEGTAAILSAELAALGAELPLCNGTNDLLPVTFTFPVAGMPMPEDFEVTIGTLDGTASSVVQPACATLAPAAEPNERRTVLLLGSFMPSADLGPITVTVVGSLSLLINGTEESVTDSFIRSGTDDFFFFTGGPRVVDFDLLDLTEPANDATSDASGCAAVFPDSSYAIRLIFGAGVRQLTDGTLENLGMNGTPERAGGFFALRAFGFEGDGEGVSAERDEILGIADVDPDNVVDVCVQSVGSLESGLQSELRVTCGPEDDRVIFDPAGDPCSLQIVLLSSLSGGPASFEFSSSSSSSSTGSSMATANGTVSMSDSDSSESTGPGGSTATMTATATSVSLPMP